MKTYNVTRTIKQTLQVEAKDLLDANLQADELNWSFTFLKDERDGLGFNPYDTTDDVVEQTDKDRSEMAKRSEILEANPKLKALGFGITTLATSKKTA
jgi:hypothetical protein